MTQDPQQMRREPPVSGRPAAEPRSRGKGKGGAVKTRAKGRPAIRRRAARSVLPVIAGLLLFSGALRLSDGVSRALAADSDPPQEAPAETAIGACEGTPELLAAFDAREERVSRRETQVEDRMQALRVAEGEIEEKLQALQAAEERLSATLALSETAAEDDLTRLTAVYENMKTEDAAALFEQMAPEFSAGFIARMQPEIAAAVMSRLEAGTAYSISAILAGRNAAAPTE
ncbi:MotE family protein [Pseudoroseicyclus aestuarii]|uniref:Flagellar motility protein MotE (MotC chaperone) n=1 Tax=Pseudoroseicyclus aestuarii TaxID=1795041 RepID=A0A318SSZ2_9RHOB|nr:hypothetical protein [Pseudoroseicyclus aestuarii]PYE84592.1 flagellar motility protein MotE (MotC chaperone) [Pseudoroseicyclus aestuarii]